MRRSTQAFVEAFRNHHGPAMAASPKQYSRLLNYRTSVKTIWNAKAARALRSYQLVDMIAWLEHTDRLPMDR